MTSDEPLSTRIASTETSACRRSPSKHASNIASPLKLTTMTLMSRVGMSGLWCFRHQLLLPCPYLVLTKTLRLDIQCQRAASVKIGWKCLDD